jgi:hypothetical protein
MNTGARQACRPDFDAGVELNCDTGGRAQLLQEELHFLGLIVQPVHAVAADGIAFPEPPHELLVEARLVEVEEVAEQGVRPHATERAVGLEEPHLRARTRRGDGGRHAGRAGTTDDHVGIGVERHCTRGFGERAGACFSSLRS